MGGLYHRGFVLSLEPQEVPGYVEFPLEGAYFYHHPSLPVWRVDSDIFAGRAINVTGGPVSAEQLDDLSGRFIILQPCENGLRVLHDACGLRSVFYAKDRPIVASHARLIGGEPSRAELARSDGAVYKFGWPGSVTPFKGVHMLTPNTSLEFPVNRVTRYFPVEDVEPMPVDEAADIVLSGMRRQLEAIIESGLSPVIGLTAGIDSRLTMAAAKPYFDEVRFFTYYAEQSELDVRLATVLAERCGARHETLCVRVDDREAYAEMCAISRLNAHYNHDLRFPFAYRKVFDEASVLHIRSNLSEIGRAFWRTMRKNPFTGADSMAATYAKGEPYDAVVEESFAEFIEDTAFTKIRNYNPYDMQYWEHRMGCWHSNVVLDSDLAFDTHVLFNARRILKAMLAVPLADRMKATLFHEIIRRELPELADIPINPKVWPL